MESPTATTAIILHLPFSILHLFSARWWAYCRFSPPLSKIIRRSSRYSRRRLPAHRLKLSLYIHHRLAVGDYHVIMRNQNKAIAARLRDKHPVELQQPQTSWRFPHPSRGPLLPSGCGTHPPQFPVSFSSSLACAWKARLCTSSQDG